MSRAARSRARSKAVQALYQWQMTGQSIGEVETQFLSEEDMAGVDINYFSTLLGEVAENSDRLDNDLAPLLDRPIDQVDPVERAILRLGACEMAFHIEIPFRVVINESVEIAKTFGAEQGHKYVNSILDKLARKLRAAEVGSARK